VTATAVEINKHACRYLQRIPGLEIVNKSILEYNPSKKYDLAFTRGVLIHINPEELNHVYDLLWSCSSKYICIAEYYNPEPEQVSYRGHVGKLFKRDFAGEFMDRHSQCRLIDYGFIYHRDPQWPADDITWFMLKKTIHICEK
jgi:spore coat polysaccharide biosynthesis protein SpsF